MFFLKWLFSSFRPFCCAIAFACFALMVVAFYLQYVLFLEPCPLCMLQRLSILSIGSCAVLAAVHDPKNLRGQSFYLVLMSFAASLGLVVALRHLWIQSLPIEAVPACGAGWDFMVNTLPLSEMLLTILKGSGECADKNWQLLGLTLPGWVTVLLSFFLFTFYCVSKKLKKISKNACKNEETCV